MIFKFKSADRIGKHKRKLTLWHLESGLYCQAGCFFGTVKDFKEAVIAKYGRKCEYMEALSYLKRTIKKY